MRQPQLISLSLLCCVFICGCSPFYVLRAAYEEGKILAGRQKIEDAIASPNTPERDRGRLKLVLEARAFSGKIGLSTGNSFTSYSRIDRDVLDYFQADGPGWQERINEALRKAIGK